MITPLDKDAIIPNFLTEIAELKKRLDTLEKLAASGLFDGTTLVLPTPTETLRVVDSGTTGATEQAWIEVENNGVQGFVRVFAAV